MAPPVLPMPRILRFNSLPIGRKIGRRKKKSPNGWMPKGLLSANNSAILLNHTLERHSYVLVSHFKAPVPP
jgi:hypothetical protein